jgi:hypothetical protein
MRTPKTLTCPRTVLIAAYCGRTSRFTGPARARWPKRGVSAARAPVQPLVGQPPPPELAALVAGTATVARRCQRCEPATLRATWRGHGATDILFFLLRYPSLTSSFPKAVQRPGSPGPRDQPERSPSLRCAGSGATASSAVLATRDAGRRASPMPFREADIPRDHCALFDAHPTSWFPPFWSSATSQWDRVVSLALSVGQAESRGHTRPPRTDCRPRCRLTVHRRARRSEARNHRDRSDPTVVLRTVSTATQAKIRPRHHCAGSGRRRTRLRRRDPRGSGPVPSLNRRTSRFTGPARRR